jgi:hypothetical protein
VAANLHLDLDLRIYICIWMQSVVIDQSNGPCRRIDFTEFKCTIQTHQISIRTRTYYGNMRRVSVMGDDIL